MIFNQPKPQFIYLFHQSDNLLIIKSYIQGCKWLRHGRRVGVTAYAGALGNGSKEKLTKTSSIDLTQQHKSIDGDCRQVKSS